MTTPKRFLTINRHESYLCTLAQTGHHFDVVVKWGQRNFGWNPAARPPPSNIRLVSFDEDVRVTLQKGKYDAVICHTVTDLLFFCRYHLFSRRQKFIMIFHIMLIRDGWKGVLKAALKKMWVRLFRWSHPNTKFVFVSAYKQKSWELAGEAIPLAPLPFAEIQTRFQPPEMVLVGNDILMRPEVFGQNFLQLIMEKFPVTILGHNPTLKNSYRPKNFSDFSSRLSRASIFIFTTPPTHNDGFNTALLEAMSLGLVVVTTPHPTSPIVHNVTGLIAHTPDEMIAHLQHLQSSPDDLHRLGEAARQNVASLFPLQYFTDRWNKVFS